MQEFGRSPGNSQKDMSLKAKLLHGFEGLVRKQTAKYMFNHPEKASDWISLRTDPLTEALAAAKNESDYLNWLRLFASQNPLHHATSTWDRYVFIPPLLKPRATWTNLIKDFSLPKATCERLFEAGFVPIRMGDIEQALDFLLNMGGKYHGPKPNFRYALLDSDYGIAILPPHAPRKNVPVDVSLFMRYLEDMPFLTREPSLIYDIGALRAHQLLEGSLTNEPDILCIDVATRGGLDTILKNIRQKARAQGRFQLWYRGQPCEYRLPDLRDEAGAGSYPWREIQDISQVPSLYRNQLQQISSLHTYCQRLLEFQKYYLFIKETLGIPDFVTRSSGKSAVEKLPQKWNKNSLKLSWELTTDGETIEYHDWENSFRGLQAGLFLQHYGLESNILDLTNDIEIALFFAQKEISNQHYVDVDFSKKQPVIYIFVLDTDLDPVVNTSQLLESFNLLRPKRQKCGILAGASLVNRNFYARFIGIKIILQQKIKMRHEDPEYLFPDPAKDKFLNNLLVFSELQNMSFIKPFVLEK